MVKTRSPPAEHNFLIESIKASHVYSRIMIVVNKLMQPSRSRGINVNKGGTMAAREGGLVDGYMTKKQLKNCRNI